jgi:hypothetical protein
LAPPDSDREPDRGEPLHGLLAVGWEQLGVHIADPTEVHRRGVVEVGGERQQPERRDQGTEHADNDEVPHAAPLPAGDGDDRGGPAGEEAGDDMAEQRQGEE